MPKLWEITFEMGKMEWLTILMSKILFKVAYIWNTEKKSLMNCKIPKLIFSAIQ